MTTKEIGSDQLKAVLQELDLAKISVKIQIDEYTLKDIVLALQKPTLDPRDEIPKPQLRSDVLVLADLKVGMKLTGTIRNVVDFGAFVDIGLKNDGLIHISEISNEYIKHPSEQLAIGDMVECTVINIENERVSLSLKR